MEKDSTRWRRAAMWCARVRGNTSLSHLIELKLVLRLIYLLAGLEWHFFRIHLAQYFMLRFVLLRAVARSSHLHIRSHIICYIGSESILGCVYVFLYRKTCRSRTAPNRFASNAYSMGAKTIAMNSFVFGLLVCLSRQFRWFPMKLFSPCFVHTNIRLRLAWDVTAWCGVILTVCLCHAVNQFCERQLISNENPNHLAI